MEYEDIVLVLCNSADIPADIKAKKFRNILKLEYRKNSDWGKNIKLKLPDFVRNVYYLPDRILDLLEISAYVYSADRSIKRGTERDLVYNGWGRNFHFIVKVRDINFWNDFDVSNKLSEVINFITGDNQHKFIFQSGHSTPTTGLFNNEEFEIEHKEETIVTLFSGGLDSLAGVVKLLNETESQICLISHRSYQPGIVKTQDNLFEALTRKYPNRLHHYKYYCSLSLKGKRAKEESQRSRSFLYTSIAYALAHALSQKSLYIYENGVTSLNFQRRTDMINARNSRTTHPKTIELFKRFYSKIEGEEINIETPFLWKTKTDVFNIINDFNEENLISSSVSCSKTFNAGQGTHCGGCFQCIDRRFAAYASNLDNKDGNHLYNLNFINESIEDEEVKITLLDYIRQAVDFSEWNIDKFYKEKLDELVEVIDYIPNIKDEETIKRIWNLCRRHGEHILSAIRKMRNIYDDPTKRIQKNSLLQLVNERRYLEQPINLLAKNICDKLAKALPIAFQKHLPEDENDLNDKIQAILSINEEDFNREHPAISFACTKAIPDHSMVKYDLLIESKYIRSSTTPSKASEGVAADLTKYPENSFKLFIVYDPNRSIAEDDKFKEDFERKGNCKICIVR